MNKNDLFSLDDSTPNQWSKDDIKEFMVSFKNQSKVSPVQTQVTWREAKKKHPVHVGDPRPPIKQRLGIEGDIGKCPHCYSERVYHDTEEEWICGFCYEE